LKTQFIIKFSLFKDGSGAKAVSKCGRFNHNYAVSDYLKNLMGTRTVAYFYGWVTPANRLYIENDVRLDCAW